ncbi:UNVERIFIED_CONTAM: protein DETOXIFICATION 27 [Sesamum angustifolium]|uniref:Protein DETOXIFICATION n=1 Tax=Sesamum angustifolium TaxID=2727405 RepID=A0AAW2L3V0_9LAMI
MSVGHHQPLLLSISEDSENQINHQPHESDPGSSASARYCVKEAWTEFKKLWQIAAPSIFCRLAMFSLTLITQSFAGHLDQRQLAAISIATTVIISISFGFLLGMASALETLCGQAYGGKQYHLLVIYLQRSWVVLFLSSILLLPLFIFATPILKLIGQPTLLAELTGEVAMWLIPMHLSFVFQFTLMRFLQCQLKTYVIAWVSGVVLVVHLLLSWIFVYKLRVGIVGAALTLDFSWWMSVLGMFIYSVCGGCRNSWTGLSRQAFIGLWDFFKLALASGVMLSISFYGWESMIPLGLFAATGIRVANEIGAGNGNSAKFAAKVSVFNSLVVGFVFFLVIIAFPGKIAMIFTSSSSVISMVEGLALLLAITILFNCIQRFFQGVEFFCQHFRKIRLLMMLAEVPLIVCIFGKFLRVTTAIAAAPVEKGDGDGRPLPRTALGDGSKQLGGTAMPRLDSLVWARRRRSPLGDAARALIGAASLSLVVAGEGRGRGSLVVTQGGGSDGVGEEGVGSMGGVV